ncbi:MAG: VCBS repeat-containing protein [Planctomycetales bacterium]|nr:VCBS repeat-containing protein [bacterium]UNM09910.1 MAG: VCBS repeat-containing protein [Planctomycetales bacterium]
MHRYIFVAVLGLLLYSCADNKGQPPVSGGMTAGGGQQAGSGGGLFADMPESDAQVSSVEFQAGSSGGAFVKLEPSETGMDFTSEVLSKELKLDAIAVQAGMATGDYDGDGDIDIYLCGIENDNALYRNEGGWQFTDVTDEAASGLRMTGDMAETAVMADLNGDNVLDIYVGVRGGVNRYFAGNGDGTFSDRSEESGLDSARSTVVSAVFDVDNDGDLDVYNANNRKGRNDDRKIEDMRSDGRYFNMMKNMETGEVKLDETMHPEHYMDKAGKIRLRPDNDDLLINDGNGHFTNEALERGIQPAGWALNALACDFNNDGWTDLQVSGDFDTPDWYYINDGKGNFTERGEDMLRVTSYFGMGSDAGDLNHDGWMDYMVGDMSPTGYKDGKKQSGDMNLSRYELVHYEPHQNMRNTVLLNRGDGWMSEAAALLNVKSTDWTWSIRLADLNSDGILEILATNGYISTSVEYDVQRRIKDMYEAGASIEEIDAYELSLPALETDDIIFTASEPLNYKKAPDNWGIHDQAVSCGCVLQDMDGDGDLDFVVNNTAAQVGVYRNDLDNGNMVLLDLRQEGPNREAVGARVKAYCGDDMFMQDVILARGYASGESSRIHLGLGEHQKIDALWIRWPDNKVEVLRDLDANMLYSISRGSKLVDYAKDQHQPMFSQQALNWQQQELDTLDAEFAKEPLLPVRRSTLGTGLGVADMNADGNLDIYFAGPQDQQGKLFTGRADGGFAGSPMLDDTVDARPESMGVLLFEANGDGRPDMLLTSGSNESEDQPQRYLDRIYLSEGDGWKAGALPVEQVPSGSAAASDIDNDGDLDLVIAGRLKPYTYGQGVHSHVLENDGQGGFTLATGRIAPGLADSGPVSDICFADINGDGRDDLLVAQEFGSVEWWANNDGNLLRQGPVGPTGMWQSVVAADFDNDGDNDLICGNWGLNTKYHPSAEKPYMVIADDFDGNGTRDVVEVKFGSDGTLLPGRGRSCSGYAISTVPQKFPTWEMFANATLEEIYGPVDAVSEKLTADHVASAYFENDGSGNFSMTDLPTMAQVSCVMGVAVGDFNNDGKLDAWLNNNFRNTQPEETRWVCGYGTLMLGNGDGSFNCLEPLDSGIRVIAEGRGAVAADFNGDACLDIVMSVSNSSPQVALMDPARAQGKGLLVTLTGPAGNPAAVGARLALELSDGQVLHREVQAGSGYLSSYVGPVHFGIPTGSTASKLTVSWPDGSTSEETSFSGNSVSLSHGS